MTEQHDIYTWGELSNHVSEWNKNNYPGHPIEFYAGTKWIESSIRNIENIHARLPGHLAFGYRPVPFPEVSEPEKVWIEAYMHTDIHGEKVIAPGTDINSGAWLLFADDCTIVDGPFEHWVPQSWEEMIWAANNNNACRIEYFLEPEDGWLRDPCVAADYENYKFAGVRFVDGSYTEDGDTYHHRVSGPRPPKGT